MALSLPVLPPEVALVDEGLPLVHGVTILLRALAIAHDQDICTGPESSAALLVLADRLDTVQGLLERWKAQQDL